jgi:acetate kinase
MVEVSSVVKHAKACVLTINGGSSSIKFALFDADPMLRRILAGRIERIGLPEATFVAKGLNEADNFTRSVTAPNHTTAVELLMDWIEERIRRGELTAVGHRVVHGGLKYSEPQRITAEMVEELHQLQPFDPEHLPEEILLTEAFHRRFPDLPQVACFDTAFHHGLPRVAQLLPVPRRYEAQGVRRYGFHGLSYAFLMVVLNELDRFHLVGAVIDRVPGMGLRAAYAKQYLRDKLLDHKAYIDKHGEDMPEIRNWKWSLGKAGKHV